MSVEVVDRVVLDEKVIRVEIPPYKSTADLPPIECERLNSAAF